MKTILNKVMPGELFWVDEDGQGFTQDAWVRLRDEQADDRCTYKDAKGWVGRCAGSREVWIDREEELSRWDWPEVRLVELLDIAKGIETHVNAPAVVAGMPVDDLWEINLAMVRYGSRFGEALGDSQYIYCLISDELEERGAKCNR